MAELPNIGILDRKVTIQTYSLTTNSFGEKVKIWTTHATVWAAVNYNGGKKEEEDGKLTSTDDITFTIRYMSDLISKMRVVFENKYYTIRDIEQIGRRRFSEIKTDSRVIDGNDTGETGPITADMTTITVDSTDISADQTIF